MKPSSQLAGIAGEYFVAAELSRRGFIASITMRNSPGIDILATDIRAKKAVTIRCKYSAMRKFRDEENKYLGHWDLLGL